MYSSYLDVDEIVRCEMIEVPEPKVVKVPPSRCAGNSGTLVCWSQCDRLDNRRVSTIVRKLEVELGRRFRHFIWKGLRITINGDTLDAFDPLYLHPKAEISGAQLFGEEMRFEVRADPLDSRKTGWVSVRFTELPVHAWHKLSNDEKRRIGLSKGAGVSIVRGGREVDYGWFFMGSKHRENYDDWWRCDPDKTSATYNHAEYVEQRRVMMQDWADRLDLFEQNLVEIASTHLTITLQGLPTIAGQAAAHPPVLNPSAPQLVVAPAPDAPAVPASVHRLSAVHMPEYARPKFSEIKQERLQLVETFEAPHNLSVADYAKLVGKSRRWITYEIQAGKLCSGWSKPP